MAVEANLLERCDREATRILALMVAACLLTGAVGRWHGPPAMRVALAYLIAGPCGIALIALLFRLISWGRSRIPRTAFLVALAFMAGGSVLDVGATVACSPTLAREGNPIARALLDSGQPLAAVYVTGFLGQLALLVAGAAAWAVTLRHRDSVIGAARAMGPSSVAGFVRAGLTGRPSPARPVPLARRLLTCPKAYNLLCALGACVPAGWAGRWYLGLEWLGAVPIHNAVLGAVVITATAAAFCTYLHWLESQYAQWRAVPEPRTLAFPAHRAEGRKAGVSPVREATGTVPPNGL